MATITRDTIEWVKDELESRDEVISELEDELIAALEENAALKLHITRLMTDRSMTV